MIGLELLISVITTIGLDYYDPYAVNALEFKLPVSLLSDNFNYKRYAIVRVVFMIIFVLFIKNMKKCVQIIFLNDNKIRAFSEVVKFD